MWTPPPPPPPREKNPRLPGCAELRQLRHQDSNYCAVQYSHRTDGRDQKGRRHQSVYYALVLLYQELVVTGFIATGVAVKESRNCRLMS